MTHTDQPTPEITTRIIDGVTCTTRSDIAELAGWKRGNSVNVRARTDPDFPRPIRGERIGRDYWYPLEGDQGVDGYLAILAQRAQDRKPPPVKAGDPDDLLGPEAAADAMHIRHSTFRSYVRYSVPFWTGQRSGRPLIPKPDRVTEDVDEYGFPRIHREWFRRTLAEHQAQRGGPGTGAGRPPRLV